MVLDKDRDARVQVILAAKAARERAYAPYSNFRVGAALLAQSGRIYSGCNIENASFSASLCAERAAFAEAVSAGERNFSMLAIIGGRDGEDFDFCFPCGVCRQWMEEFCDDDFTVLAAKNEIEYWITSLGELMPHAFKLDNMITEGK